MAGCAIRVEDLPFREYPYISELEFLRDLEVDGNQVKKTRYSEERVTFPLVLFFKLNEVDGPGTLQIRIYDEKGQQVHIRDFQFGESGRYYEYIIFYNRLEKLPGNAFTLALFYNRDLISTIPVPVGQSTNEN